jgi:hypothetical protein
MPLTNKGRKPRNPKTKPFFPHDSGYWAAKLGGRTVYLARWDTPLADVEERYERRRDQLAAEAEGDAAAAVVASGTPLTFKDLANLFLNHRAVDVDRGQLAGVTWAGYKRSLAWAVARIGDRPVAALRPLDFTELNGQLAAMHGAKQHEHVVGVTSAGPPTTTTSSGCPSTARRSAHRAGVSTAASGPARPRSCSPPRSCAPWSHARRVR